MMEIVFRVIELVVMLAVLGYLAVLRRIDENDRARDIFYEMQSWADIVVRWAADRLDAHPGEDRRTAGVNALKAIRDKAGIELSDEQIGMLVSSAYRVMMEESIEIDDAPEE